MKLKHNNKGFSLVELIVVIAIMAILGGVGTAGYTKYIEQTNKKADMALVGNIMRAIETGTNSTMYTPPAPLAVGTTTYPIGFVALNSEGCKVLSSNSTTKEVSGACEIVQNQTVTYVEKKNKIFTCSKNKHTDTHPVYEMKTKTLSYCKTHSENLPEILSTSKTYAKSWEFIAGFDVFGLHSHTWEQTSNLIIPANTLFIEDIGDLYELSSGSLCKKAANPGLNVSATPDESGVLYEAINAAYGDTNLQLKYDKWINDEGADFATFYTYAPDVFNKVKEQTKSLVDAVNSDIINGLADTAGKDLNAYLTEGSYATTGELLDSFAEFVSSKYTETEWNTAWATAANDNDEYTFNIDGKGGKNDYIWASRMGYNTSFASYLSANNIDSTYTSLIENYGEDEFGGAIHIPSVVNNYAFSKQGDGSLKQTFINANSSNGEEMFNQCKALYEKYINSNVCSENGAVFYSTIKTLDQTGDVAMDANNGFNGDYFAYYNSYLSEMANLYNAAQDNSKNGIMIIVSMKDGMLDFQVSPSAANPRNK